MTDYAIISASPVGVVQEIFITDLIPGVDILHPSIIAVDISGIAPQPEAGWSATLDNDQWAFSEPLPHVPTSDEVLATNSARLQQSTQLAASQKTALTNRIGTINDAIEFEEATPAEIAELPIRKAQLTLWKKYAIDLGRVTTQSGWHMTLVWPSQPSEGMDLTVSAVAPESPQLQ